MFTSTMAKITAFFISVILSLGTVFGVYKAPTTKNAAEYYDGDIKNVIFLIGDGMGYNHLEKTKKERKTSLIMDTFEIEGSSMTRSFNKKVTDSAAGGTALSAGIRTANKAVGVYNLDKKAKCSYPKSITELCKERGMLTGVVTTDETTGATPSAFSAHSSDRYNEDDLTYDQFKSEINIIWGHSNGFATETMAEEYGYEYISTYDEMMALEEGSYSYAQFTTQMWSLENTAPQTPTLQQMTMKAIDILDDTDEGFFLMVEGAHIDKHSHNNDSDKMTESLEAFDNTIEAVLEYAKEDGETLVVVTADHETGAITLKDGEYKFTSGDHSAADVPVLVYGSDKLIAQGEKLNNYEIPIRIAYLLGFDETQFPVAVIV